MDNKTAAIQEGETLRRELEEIFSGTFSMVCSGGPGPYEVIKYGKPCAHISGHVNSGKYYLTIWQNETSKDTLFSSGNERITKDEMMEMLRTFVPVKKSKQLRLF